MAAMPLDMVIGAFLLGRVAAPSARIRMRAGSPFCEATGAPLAVSLASLVGITAATMLAMS